MGLPKELIAFLKGTDLKKKTPLPNSGGQITSQATPVGMERYHEHPVIVQSGSGRLGEQVDPRILEIQETEAFKRLPPAQRRQFLSSAIARSVRSDLQHKRHPSTDDELAVLAKKKQAVQATRNNVGVSGLQKLIDRIRNL